VVVDTHERAQTSIPLTFYAGCVPIICGYVGVTLLTYRGMNGVCVTRRFVNNRLRNKSTDHEMNASLMDNEL
jgi:hypothetical protein